MLKHALNVVWWLGLSLYFGGLLTLGAIVAPAVFSTTADSHMSMPGIVSPPLDMAKQVGGEIFGAVINRFSIVEFVCLGLMFVGLCGMIWLHQSVRRSEWVLVALWIILTVLARYDNAVLRPRVWSLRSEVRASVSTHMDGMETRWPEQMEFDKLHQESELVGRAKVYLLFGMIVVSAWRGLAEKTRKNIRSVTQKG